MAKKRIDTCGGRGCVITRPAGARIAVAFPGFSYSSGSMRPRSAKGYSPPCGTARKTCPVQLVFDHGQPKLRFCRAKGEPGRLVAVSSAEEAQRVASKACACWRKTKSFDRCPSVRNGPLGRVL